MDGNGKSAAIPGMFVVYDVVVNKWG